MTTTKTRNTPLREYSPEFLRQARRHARKTGLTLREAADELAHICIERRAYRDSDIS